MDTNIMNSYSELAQAILEDITPERFTPRVIALNLPDEVTEHLINIYSAIYQSKH